VNDTSAPQLPRLILKPGKERPPRQRHPWIFSGAVARTELAPEPGGTVAVLAADGEFLGVAGWNPASQLCARLWRFDAGPVDRAFFQQRLERALAGRRLAGLLPGGTETDCFRIVHAEADGLPGLVADLYGGHLVVQVLTLAMERHLPLVLELLAEQVRPRGIFERSDVELRTKEGLQPRTGLLWGEPPPPAVAVRENGLPLLVDISGGQKTGFFLDQRENRRKLAAAAAALARERPEPLEVLNAFAYTGGFGVAIAAQLPTARITNLDASAEALALARRNFALNGIAGDDGRVAFEQANAFEWLRGCRDRGRQFDVIILDPPKFAASQAHVDKAARGYKDLILLGMKMLRPGGLLAAFSCSGAVTPELFQKIAAGAALDAGREGQILGRLGPGPDHPVALPFPEGDYLKGLLLRVW
jgi:23S rRNA (cytosine1962-C5)-methyltransferase